MVVPPPLAYACSTFRTPGVRSGLVVGGEPFWTWGVCGVEGVRTAYGESAEEDLRTEAGELGRGRWTGGL